MSISPNTPCAVCGGPNDPVDPQIVIIPKNWTHVRCWQQIPQESLWDFADTIPCCTSAVFLDGLGDAERGVVVRRKKGVPPGEIWFFDDEKDVQARFRKAPGRQVEELPVPQPLNVQRNPAEPIDSPPGDVL